MRAARTARRHQLVHLAGLHARLQLAPLDVLLEPVAQELLGGACVCVCVCLVLAQLTGSNRRCRVRGSRDRTHRVAADLAQLHCQVAHVGQVLGGAARQQLRSARQGGGGDEERCARQQAGRNRSSAGSSSRRDRKRGGWCTHKHTLGKLGKCHGVMPTQLYAQALPAACVSMPLAPPSQSRFRRWRDSRCAAPASAPPR